MLRSLVLLTVLPAGALIGWLALESRAHRADFVLTTGEPRTLDPHRVSWLPEIQLASAMFEGLTRLDPQTSRPQPAVAAQWSINPDHTAYVFQLRHDARWSNGDPVVAEDFRAAWLRVADPRCEAQYAHLLFVIRGAEDYYRSRLDEDPANDRPPEHVGVEALDAHTLRVVLGSPCPYFLELTSFATFAPVHRPTLARWAYRDGRVLRSTQHLMLRPGHVVCNGPFVLRRWDFKQRIWLERNKLYWDAASIRINSIEACIIESPNTALIAYETGRVDFVRGLERSVAERLLNWQQAGPRCDFHSADRFATFFFRVNCRRPPLDNADLRRALSLAIDREAVCAHVLRLGETPAETYVPRTLLHLMPRESAGGETICYEPPAGLGAGLSMAQRAALARELLRRSGYDRIAAERPLEIAFSPADPEERSIAEALQAMWKEHLGIHVDLRTIESKVLSTRIRDLDYDLARSNWFGDYMDPSTFLDMFTTDSGQNRTGWSHAEYDRLIAAAAQEPDNARRFALLREAERILCQGELPIIPVFHRRGNYLLNPRFTGVADNPRDLLQFHRVQPAH